MALVKTHSMITVRFQRAGLHYYGSAPQDVDYLRNEHRHLFKFEVSIQVFHEDRDIEFHQFLNWLESMYSDSTLQLNHKSCEMISDELADMIGQKHRGRNVTIRVWEDGECGSYSVYEPEENTDATP